jgi:acyl-coenzyme A synthetase/AMP-(fatty) acid ligase
MVYTATTFKYAFDYHDDDIYWCTADCGWITGHSYLTYGPLLNGASIVVFEGVPNYPDAGRCWEIVDKYKVSIFYTAPTAIRSLMRSGNEPVKRHSRKSLRVLGSVGEPINPSAWRQGTVNPSSIYLPPGCISLLVCPIHTTSVRMDHIAKQLAVTSENRLNSCPCWILF